ncbi:MAG: carboxypeptidase regulatory-like domain-containing protein, partial [Bacteroidales bacterium]|nr:carboxypeptidase regulatory-like domain-containing protein [Bacteroidales bacterium]
ETTYDQLAIRAKVFGPLFGDQILAPTIIPVSGTSVADKVESVNTAPMTLESGEVKLGGSEYLLPDGRSRFTLRGYNVYKDDVVLNGTVLTANMYVDVCSPGGIYYYNVTAVYDMGESCPIDPPYEAIVGEEFPPPTDLTGQALEGDDVLLTWNEPGEATGQWIHWDDGENANAIGLTSGGTFLVASRWGTADLVPFDGMYLTKVSLFPNSEGGGTSYALKVWTGDNAGTLVVDMPLSNLILQAWNTITLTDPVLVDATQELWFGYENIDQPEGEHPAGCDDGPAVASYGDMISMDGGATWDPLSGFGLDYNWNLQGYVTSDADYTPLSPLAQELIVNTGDVYPDAVRNEFTEASVFVGDDSRQMLLGYNLWKNGENFIYVPAPDTFYIDPAVAPGTYEYYVSAVYAEGESFWDGPAVVTITPKGDIAGYVYDGKTGTPIADAVVTADPGGFTTTTGYDGTYLLQHLPVGSYSVTASADLYMDKTLWTEVFNAEVSVVDFAMYDTTVVTMPFFEPWDDGSFETQFWTFDPEPGNWQMDTGFGNPAPSAEFNWSPSILDYSFALVSPEIDATTVTLNVTLSFDLYLSDYGSTGLEYMTVDVWDGTSWIMVDEWANTGSIDWTGMSYDITEYALGILTQVRFVAHGADSYEINNWDVDNIKVYEQIMASLQGTVTELATGNPIENAEIAVEGYVPVYTDADGFYSIAVEQGTYNVSCEADGFNPVSDELFIDNTVWDVAMTQPVMTVDPTSIFEELYQNETSTQYFTIYNDGNGILHWNAYIVETDFAPVDNLELISFDRENIEELSPNVDWSPRVTEVVNGNTDDVWDVQFVYDVTAASGGINAQAGVEFDGTYFYTTIWSGSDILKYDIDGNFIGAFAISGASGLRDLAWDGEYLYGGNAGNVIYQIDPETFNVVDQFSSPEAVRAIAYDAPNDAFWVCNWTTDFWLVARDGSMLDVIANPGVESVYGLAYDNLTGAPSLWIFSQQTGGSDFIQLDIASGTFTGVTHNVLNDIPLNGIAGGAFITTDFIPGFVTLGGLIQEDDYNTIFGYEIGTYDLWISLGTTSGTILAGASSPPLPVYFDATGLEEDFYYADIVIEPTPAVGTVIIPVQLAVSVGLDELINSGLISVYPNPATDYVNVVVTEEVREFRILSYIGQVVYEHNFAEGELLTQVNTTRFTAGTYLVEFTTQDGEVFTKSVVISR